MNWWQSARDAFDQGKECTLVRILSISGSAPREVGASMIVLEADFAGTVGGGALEHRCLQRARELQQAGDLAAGKMLTEKWILGPDIGQCCGGAVHVTLQRMDEAGFAEIEQSEQVARAQLPDDPVTEVARLSPGALVYVMSHSHDLDYDLCEAALGRPDLAFIGLIGSKTKKARFFQRLERKGMGKEVTSRVTCPIGIGGIAGKEPAVIAAAVAAQVLQIVSANKKSEDEKTENRVAI